MDVVIRFAQSAFDHGVSKKSIWQACLNVLYDDIWDEGLDKHLFLGIDDNGRLLEIMYNVIDEQAIQVFHAMKCRRIYFPLLLVNG